MLAHGSIDITFSQDMRIAWRMYPFSMDAFEPVPANQIVSQSSFCKRVNNRSNLKTSRSALPFVYLYRYYTGNRHSSFSKSYVVHTKAMEIASAPWEIDGRPDDYQNYMKKCGLGRDRPCPRENPSFTFCPKPRKHQTLPSQYKPDFVRLCSRELTTILANAGREDTRLPCCLRTAW